MENKYFVTIKQGKTILLNKVAFFSKESDIVKNAKIIRMRESKNWNLKPSDLSWAVFDFYNPDNPMSEQSIIAKSSNYEIRQ